MQLAVAARVLGLILALYGLTASAQTALDSSSELILYFKLGESSLDTAARRRLTDFYVNSDSQSAARVSVVGYADQSGDEQLNLELSRKRAQTVAQKLLKLGLSPSQLQVDWKGEFEPIAPNETQAPDERNRRVVVSTSP